MEGRLFAFLMLQEAQSGLDETLGRRQRWVRSDDGECWESLWTCVRGLEQGNSLMVACRTFMLSSMNRLLWIRRADGMYKDNASEGNILRTARSRILVVAVSLKLPWCGMIRVVVCNCHLHRLTANKSHGLQRPTI